MASRQTKKAVTKAAINDTPERFKLSEAGYLGLNVWNGVTQDEIKRELNFPHSVKTFKQMTYHSTINSPLTLFDNLIGKVQWTFKAPKDASDEEKRQAQIINEMMHDMQDQTWQEFISDALSSNVFGFSVHEKVYRRRNSSTGSKHNDNLIGWKRLPIRNQETIEKFIFSDDGNDILGVKQNLTTVSDLYNRYTNRTLKEVTLPRSKIMLFRAGKHKGDPFGKSMLRDAYQAWRFLTVIEEIEANGVAKDLVGLPVLHLPPQYLSADASPEQKQIRAYYENVMRNLQLNQQSALILPQAFDPDTRQPMFELKLLSLNGAKAMDTTAIKEYYKNMILTSMFADILMLGQSGGGSLALGQLKNSLSANAAESMLDKIAAVINNDLIKQTYELNGWDTSRMGFMDYDNLDAEDLESFSKAIQRFASTSVIEVDRPVLNKIRESIGVDPLPADEEPRKDYMPKATSRSGDGMAVGTSGNGTATSVSGNDTSSNNLENAG
jgi:hypothetical protein